MKRFKVFKIIYYSFAVVIGIILCFVLPSYNQYNQYMKAIEKHISAGEYSEVARLNAPYVNANEVAYTEGEDGSKAYIYESITAQPVESGSNSSYAEQTYVGFVFYPKDYKYEATQNSSGKDEYKRGILINEPEKNQKLEIENESFYYVTDLNFFYFEILKSDLESFGVDSINKLTIIDNQGNAYLTFGKDSELNLNFSSDFYDLTDTYVGYVQQYYTNVEMKISGTANLAENCTEFKAGTKITYTPFSNGTMTINASDLEGMKISGATRKENSSLYNVSAKTAVEIEFTSDKALTSIMFEYGSIDVEYGFNGKGTYYLDKNVTSDEDVFIGKSLDEDKLEADYENWKKDYDAKSGDGFLVYDNSSISKKGTIWTIVQIVIYALVILIVGDLLVGKRRIIALFSRLFGKRKPKEKDEVEINNDYEVNVVCTAFVPVGYTDKVSVLYTKDNGDKMIFELDANHNYKLAKRFKNGKYEFQGLEAKGLHLIRTNRTINVRGYRFELVLNLAYDEVSPEVKDAEVIDTNNQVLETKDEEVIDTNNQVDNTLDKKE